MMNLYEDVDMEKLRTTAKGIREILDILHDKDSDKEQEDS